MVADFRIPALSIVIYKSHGVFMANTHFGADLKRGGDATS